MIQTLKKNIDRLTAAPLPIWYIVTENGAPQQFSVAQGRYHFSDVAWPAASLFLKGTAETVATAAGAVGKAVEVVQLKHHLMAELERAQREEAQQGVSRVA